MTGLLMKAREARVNMILLLFATMQLTLVYLSSNGIEVYATPTFRQGALTMGYGFLVAAFVVAVADAIFVKPAKIET